MTREAQRLIRRHGSCVRVLELYLLGRLDHQEKETVIKMARDKEIPFEIFKEAKQGVFRSINDRIGSLK